jgi:hypothetical protein
MAILIFKEQFPSHLESISFTENIYGKLYSPLDNIVILKPYLIETLIEAICGITKKLPQLFE